MKDAVVILIILVLVGAAIAYIVKSKKKGVKCIGCPYAESCAKKDVDPCKGGGGCNCH